MKTTVLSRLISRPTFHLQIFNHAHRTISQANGARGSDFPASMAHVRCASTKSGGKEKKQSARLAEVQKLLYQAEERYKADGSGVEPVPKLTLEHVTIGYARSGGSGGQNANNIVNSKIEMRFNVKNALWLNEKVRERIMQMEKYRINKDGEIVITSSKTRTQQGNFEDALAKLQVFTYQKKKLQEIIDAASYVPVPPSNDTMKKIELLSALAEQKRMNKLKAQSRRKALQRS
ncbi:Class I peptide chain release factor [Striga hermonthica]|uniref:Class I peptide chain release factor n=1 Tax=Striga hermonthica TaxID=68872 RepID=A0A9N7RI01_STRHE|nr:Class I peptide chain release factor [Striga hermonthica]